MTKHEMRKHQETTPARREETRSPGKILIPAVDIFESAESLTLIADLPGVEMSGLAVTSEKDTISIDGTVEMTGRGRPLLREFTMANYHRQFKLSDQFDTEKSYAELRDGVLILRVPKAEAAKPKRIKIRH